MAEATQKPKRSLFRKIINFFLWSFIVIFILVMIFIGISQTRTFREFLRKQVVALVNELINGKLSIDRIDGTILTSITLRNTLLTFEQDTVLAARRIELQTAPLKLLLRELHVRSFLIEDAKIDLIKDSLGIYNIAKLAKPTEEDTTTSEFPFTIRISDVQLRNIDFKSAKQENKFSSKSYPSINLDDFRVDDLFFQFNAYVNMKRKYFNINIDGISGRTNLSGFTLKNFSGEFELTEEDASVKNLRVLTNGTDFDLDATVHKFYLFKNFSYEKMKTCPVDFNLTTRIFNFSELSSFVPATNILKGTITTNVVASGIYGNLKIDRISVDYLKTHIEGKAVLKSLQDPANLYIKAQLNNSYINQPDILSLLPDVKAPGYNNLFIKNISAEFEGKPNNFTSTLKADFPQGQIAADAKMDLTTDKIKYDIKFSTQNLNLVQVIKNHTNLNLTAFAKGEGTDLKTLSSNIKFSLYPSTYNGYRIDSLDLSAKIVNASVDYNLSAFASGASVLVNGDADFTNEKNPEYNALASIRNLKMDKILSDISMRSNLNLDLDLKGRGFNPDDLEANLKVKIDSSYYTNLQINPNILYVNFIKQGDNKRIFNLDSDIGYLELAGDYKIMDVVSIAGYQADIFKNLITRKINSINPYALFKDTTGIADFESGVKQYDKIPEFVSRSFNIDYKLELKDLNKQKTIEGLRSFDVVGKITGNISNKPDDFQLTSKLELNRLKLLTKDNVIYVSELSVGLNIGRDNRYVNADNIYGKISLTNQRIFAGTDVKNLKADVALKNNIFDYSFAADLDTTMSAKLTGSVDVSNDFVLIQCDDFFARYKNIILKNDGKLIASYNKDYFNVDQFRLVRNGSSINLNGKIYGNGAEDITLSINNLGLDLFNEFTTLKDNSLSGKLNLDVKMSGYLHDPVINVDFKADDIIAKGVSLGFIRCNLDYKDKLLSTNLKFLDSTYNLNEPSLVMEGLVPINLAFVNAGDRFVKDREIQLNLKSKQFELAGFSNLSPYTRELSGKLIADINISGSFDDINLNGKLLLQNCNFILKQNNLPYSLNINLLFEGGELLVDKFSLQNTGKTNFGGTLTGSGNIDFNNKTADVTLNGDLAVLSQSSKTAMPFFYGDVAIKTNGDWKFTYVDGNSSFTGNVLLRHVNVTIPQTKTGYSTTSTDYIYKYVIDSSKIDRKQEEFKEVVALSRKYSPLRTAASARPKKTSFDFKVGIKIDDEAKLSVVLNQEANQRLDAILNGELLFENGGVAQGAFNLLEGSQLTFFKTFGAEGKIYFESDVTNPRLDVVATYQSTIEDSTGSTDVAVKIKLEGSIDKLAENLSAKGSDAFSVYEGESNISKGIPSPDRTNLDAITFILLDKFNMDAGDKATVSRFFNPTDITNSALSGVLSTFANQYLGDVVRNINLEERGSSTRLSVSGKIQKLKYSFGTKTEEFQDITKANLKLEYPFSEFFLIKFERKDPILENLSNTEKINEVGLKYKFVF
ncbi:MAG: hypothetical protein C4539_13570 [Ignavibacteriales bacterium]|nr:MAG: hypothetical protein C4539_13570 [Ignavibacteriales bacterium]